jgi:hypothetical protein
MEDQDFAFSSLVGCIDCDYSFLLLTIPEILRFPQRTTAEAAA